MAVAVKAALIFAAALVWTTASSCSPLMTPPAFEGRTLRVDYSPTGGAASKPNGPTAVGGTEICARASHNAKSETRRRTTRNSVVFMARVWGDDAGGRLFIPAALATRIQSLAVMGAQLVFSAELHAGGPGGETCGFSVFMPHGLILSRPASRSPRVRPALFPCA